MTVQENPTNFHPYVLNNETLQQIIRDQFLYNTYLNAIALVHDLVSEFSITQDKPRLQPWEAETQIATVSMQLAKVPLARESIEENWQLARQIRREAEFARTTIDQFAIETKATQLAEGLLQLYTTIRIARRTNLT